MEPSGVSLSPEILEDSKSVAFVSHLQEAVLTDPGLRTGCKWKVGPPFLLYLKIFLRLLFMAITDCLATHELDMKPHGVWFTLSSDLSFPQPSPGKGNTSDTR